MARFAKSGHPARELSDLPRVTLAHPVGTLIQWADSSMCPKRPFPAMFASERCERWQEQERVHTRVCAHHLSLSEPLLQAGSSWHSSQEQRPRAKHLLITAYHASFCVSVDTGQSAKHREFLPARSELIPGTHPCLTMGPIAIRKGVADTVGKPITHPARGLSHALMMVLYPSPHRHLWTPACHEPQRSLCGFIIHLPLVSTHHHQGLQKAESCDFPTINGRD